MKPLKTVFAIKQCNLVIQDNNIVLDGYTVFPGDKMLFMNQGVMFDTVRSVNINSVIV